MGMIEDINSTTIRELLLKHGSPLYVYNRRWLSNRCHELIEAAEMTDCIVRYAIKANPHPEIIKLFDQAGLHFDASSGFEVTRLIEQGIDPAKISLSSQQPPADLEKLLKQGIKFVATSLYQLDLVAKTQWQGPVAVRINPGIGSGHSQRTTTGGVSASFGIWHEYLPKILEWQSQSGSQIERLHVHIGSGADPAVWRKTIQQALAIVEQLPEVNTLDIGGGYKVARMPDEQATDMKEVMAVFKVELEAFAKQTGRNLNLEIEPGTWLVANAGTLVSNIVDIVDTGAEGYKFIKLNVGMNDILRPSLYGAQHPIKVLNDQSTTDDYVVVGHNCESGDILTPKPGEPEMLLPRTLNQASIDDIVLIGGAGAYCASMSANGYNSYPDTQEIVV